MSVLNQSGEEQVECPLCMEPLEVDDLNFFPCTCGYQICRFCWHRIRTDENGLCPACRKAYPENPADFKPLSQEEVAKLKAEKRHKDQQRKQKITENRKHLANVRVVQRNLVFVVGLPMRLADSEVLKKHEYFGKFGKIHKVVINQSTSYAGTQGPSASAYVTYQKADDALRAIQAVNNILVDGRSIKSSLGTTKYCSHFMKNQPCPKPDCMYLHDQGDPEASFTKEEMQQGKHQEYERKLHEALINATNQRERKPTPSPPAVSLPSGGGGANPIAVTAAITCLQAGQTGNKEAWPSLQPGMATNSGGSSSSGSSNGTAKGENGRKQSATKNPNLTKKRHSSGDDLRGKSKDKQLYNSDDQDSIKTTNNELQTMQQLDPPRNMYMEDETHSSSLEMQSTSESVSLDSDDGGGGKCDITSSKATSAARLAAMTINRTATLFEPDNNSFFSTNNFTKIAACSQGSVGSDWPINGLMQTHFPDDLQNMPVDTTEDWQAAFSSHIVAEKNAETAQHTASQSEEDQTEQLNNDQNITSKFNGDIINTGPLENIPPSKFILEDYRNDKITFGEGNPSHIFNSLHSQFGQEPNVYMVNRHQFLNSTQQQPGHTQLNSQHLIPNGLPPTQATSKFLAEFHSRQQNQPNHLESNSLLGNSHLDPTNYTKNHLDPSKYVKNIQNMHLDGGSSYLVNNLQSHNIEGSSYRNDHMSSAHADSNSYGNGKFNPSLAVSNGLLASQNSQRLQNGDILEENGYIDVGNYQRKVNEAEKYLNYQRKINSGDFGVGELVFDDFKYGKCDDLAKEFGIGEDCANDDLGFDPFHETQKGFAEIMGGEVTGVMQKHHEANHESNHYSSGSYQHTNHLNNPPLGFSHVQSQNTFGGSKLLPTLNQQQQQQQQILAQQNHRLSANVSGCTKLLEGLGLGPTSNSVPTRTRLPPPGFSTAPNHMNAFGLGIPRAPTNNGSKILPFMGLGSSNGGSLSPVPPQQQQQQQQSMLFGGAQAPRGFPMPNGIKVSGAGDPAAYSVKDWSENLRGLIPLSGGFGQGPNTSSPPPTQTQHSSMFNTHHATLQSSNSKGWTGPCTDWTALDPAIVSSSRSAPHSNLQPHGGPSPLQTHSGANPLLLHTNPLLSQHVQNNSTHWLRNLEENNSLYFGGQLPDWSLGSNSSSLAAPPPGFSVRQQSKTLSATADMTKIENL